MATDDLLQRLKTFSSFLGKESEDGAYEMASACLEAASVIEQLSEQIKELQDDEIVIVGPDGAELCRFVGDEAQQLREHAMEILVTTILQRAVDRARDIVQESDGE